jgi:hypothetical protein
MRQIRTLEENKCARLGGEGIVQACPLLEEREGKAGANMRQMGTLQGRGKKSGGGVGLRRGAKKGRAEEAYSKMRQTSGHAGG